MSLKMIYHRTALSLCFLLYSAAAVSQTDEWTSCSRTCGMGISYRLLPCQNANCTGEEKEFRACNIKDCPEDNIDFRSEQCKKYGEELMPFNDSSNPCKLMCILPGQKPEEKAIAIDGTPCLSSGICVDGICVPVGCDGILGSEEKIDECGRCGSANGICLRVPCIINHNLITNEYSTTVPTGSTRINITWTSSCKTPELNDKNVHLTDDSVHSKVLTINGPLKEGITVKINCQEGGHILSCKYHTPLYKIKKYYYDGDDIREKHYQWIVGNEFTICSQTCGIGIQRSRVYCRDNSTKKIAEDLFCNNLTKDHLKIHMRKCNMPPCPYKWNVTDWSPCSKSCGRGHRNRNVTCVQTIDTLSDPVTKDTKECLEKKPRSHETCNHHHCYDHWHKGSWNECSSYCGNGTRTRNVTCINAHGKEEETNNCSLLVKPKEEENCIGEMCTYRWITFNWSNCSVNCGQGNQSRIVHCQYINESKAVNDSLCLQSSKPTVIQQCQGAPCAEWKAEEWGKCETPNCTTKGSRYRNIYCVVNGSSGVYVDNTKCNHLIKPNAVEDCCKTEGCTPGWVYLPWGECTKSCKGGQRTRGLECKLCDKLVDETLCPDIKDTIFEECNMNVQCSSCIPSNATCKAIIKQYYCNGLDVGHLCKLYCCHECTQDLCM